MWQPVSNSLSEVVDEINHSVFFREPIDEKRKSNLANWISSRIHKSGGYNGLFAPTEKDLNGPIKTFTGELVTSVAGKAHLLGEEALNALVSLNIHTKDIDKSIEDATNIIDAMIKENETEDKYCGFFCCGKCTVSYWRNLINNRLSNSKERLTQGLIDLEENRDQKGRWKRFPFYYTSYVLDETPIDSIKRQLRYIEPVLQRISKRKFSNDKYGIRRKYIVKTLLCKTKKI
ncbi:MAG: hypothetical protein KAH01_03610 [Caldisericia bacterium]|nr:hypothetical protein [Caldisericia bacterium]